MYGTSAHAQAPYDNSVRSERARPPDDLPVLCSCSSDFVQSVLQHPPKGGRSAFLNCGQACNVRVFEHPRHCGQIFPPGLEEKIFLQNRPPPGANLGLDAQPVEGETLAGSLPAWSENFPPKQSRAASQLDLRSLNVAGAGIRDHGIRKIL
jgi:hypothetical protein